MIDPKNSRGAQFVAEREVQGFKDDLGPFVVAADSARIPMLFTNARSAENEIVYLNQSLLELTGYDKAELLGLPFHCLLAQESDRLRMTPEVIAGRPKSTVDLLCLRHNRSVFDASVLASPVCDEEGNVRQFFISLFDLTEPVERRVQDRLREAEIYRHAPGFIAFTSGSDHRITFANTAYETLVGPRDLIGRSVIDAFPELAEQGFIKLLDHVFENGERAVGKNMPVQLARAPGGDLETRYIDFIYEPVRDASGAVTGLFCEGSDITEARMVSNKLDDVQGQLMHVSRVNAMGAMAATLAHELNQPLAAIANYAAGCINILDERGAGSEDLQEGLSAIVATTARAGKIIANLRGMTKRMTPASEVFDLSAALEEAAHLVRAGGCENVSISTKGRPGFLVSGDKIQIQQVIVNLLRNACDAASESQMPGTVLAHATKMDGDLCVVVRDNGPGLPAELAKDPFKWVQSPKPEGMGIGLSICRTISEAHAGRITLDKTGPSGTTFSFCLPAVRDDGCLL